MKVMLKKILCFFGKHDYYVIKNYSSYARKVGCRQCPKAWAMNDQVRGFIEWNGEFEDLYENVLPFIKGA